MSTQIGDVIDAFGIPWEKKMRKILNATQSTAKLTHEGETIAWSAIVQGAIFFHYSSKRGVKTARKSILSCTMEENNRWKKIKYNLREIIFQSDAKKKRMWNTQIECKGQD